HDALVAWAEPSCRVSPSGHDLNRGRRQVTTRKTGTTMRMTTLSSLFATCVAGALLSACGGGDSAGTSTLIASSDTAKKCDDSSDKDGTPGRGHCPVALTCDDSMIKAFKPDKNTTVTLVKAFKKGDPLALSGTPASPPPPVALNDMCLVKLTIGPGNPGPAG